MNTCVAGMQYREEAYLARGLKFPWDKLSDKDEVTLVHDPKGSVMGNPHNDPCAYAVVHSASQAWLGYLPHKDAKIAYEKHRKGYRVARAFIDGFTNGGGRQTGRGIAITIEFG